MGLAELSHLPSQVAKDGPTTGIKMTTPITLPDLAKEGFVLPPELTAILDQGGDSEEAIRLFSILFKDLVRSIRDFWKACHESSTAVEWYALSEVLDQASRAFFPYVSQEILDDFFLLVQICEYHSQRLQYH